MSSATQDAQLQRDALVADGVQQRDIFADVTSGSRTAVTRPGGCGDCSTRRTNANSSLSGVNAGIAASRAAGTRFGRPLSDPAVIEDKLKIVS